LSPITALEAGIERQLSDLSFCQTHSLQERCVTGEQLVAGKKGQLLLANLIEKRLNVPLIDRFGEK